MRLAFDISLHLQLWKITTCGRWRVKTIILSRFIMNFNVIDCSFCLKLNCVPQWILNIEWACLLPYGGIRLNLRHHHHLGAIVLHSIFVVIHVSAETSTFSTPWRTVAYLVCFLKERCEVIPGLLIVPCFFFSYIIQFFYHILKDWVRLLTFH